MKELHKNVSVGEYQFGIVVDRDITADCFEEFPDLLETMVTYKGGDEDLVRAIKEKKIRNLLSIKEDIGKIVAFGFPKMLKKADKVDDTNNYPKANEILEYLKENDVDDEFNEEIFKFICMGFTQDTTEKKPKVKLTIK